MEEITLKRSHLNRLWEGHLFIVWGLKQDDLSWENTSLAVLRMIAKEEQVLIWGVTNNFLSSRQSCKHGTYEKWRLTISSAPSQGPSIAYFCHAKYHRLGGLNNRRNSHSAGGWQSKIKVSTGFASISSGPSPWLADGHLQTVSFFVYTYVHVQTSPSDNYISHMGVSLT